MRLMPVMSDYIHALRRQEISLIWHALGDRRFQNGLELGAGDGWSSDLFSERVANLVVTDIHPAIGQRQSTDRITYRVLDAELAGTSFEQSSMDFIVSSNLLEHLPDPGRVLREMLTVMNHDGISVHVLPSPMWKVNQLALFIPSQILRRIERYSSGNLPHWLVAKPKTSTDSQQPSLPPPCNNPKSAVKHRSYLARLLVPACHGVSTGHLEEFQAFRKSRWMGEFQQAGYEVISYSKGPWTTGFGFGCGSLRPLLRGLFPACEHIFVLRRMP